VARLTRVDATTDIVVGVNRNGASVIEHLSCEAPLLFRSAGDRGGAVHLTWVNGAAGPVGGDQLTLAVTVRAGASLVVRSAGASLVHPGPHGATSTTRLRLTLDDRARIDWWPEPSVPVIGCRHRSETTVLAAATASGRIVETVVRGRQAAHRQRVLVDDHLVLDHEVHLGAGAHASAGANGDAHAVLSSLHLGCDATGDLDLSDRRATARFALARGAVLVTAIGDDLRELTSAVLRSEQRPT
jgi:urease accessory protein